jgi:hypothetical protein
MSHPSSVVNPGDSYPESRESEPEAVVVLQVDDEAVVGELVAVRPG